MTNNQLSNKIVAFLDNYAILNPNYLHDDDNKFTSPDADALLYASYLIASGEVIDSFTLGGISLLSGGFYDNKEGCEEEFNIIKNLITQYNTNFIK